MNVHQKPRAGILLEVDLSVGPESYYYYYYYYSYSAITVMVLLLLLQFHYCNGIAPTLTVPLL